jgi:TetR/AcrR family transcriptional regulator, lmrAB and yxaGH operons repressor
MTKPLLVRSAQPLQQSPTSDTRSRILAAAQRLFRQRGYHATGLADILQLAGAPKGSMYHHFPAGKEAIGVCVIDEIASSLLGLLSASRARSTGAAVLQSGLRMLAMMEKTDYEICTLFAAFTAERKSSPALGEAVGRAYDAFAETIAERLREDGFTTRAARETALTVTALLEGGSLLSQAQQNSAAFRLSVKQAAAMCSPPQLLIQRSVRSR